MHVGETAVVTKITGRRIRAVMAEIAGYFGAIMAGAANQVARLVSQHQHLRRGQGLFSMVKTAIGALAVLH
jgi:hypothetical protein